MRNLDKPTWVYSLLAENEWWPELYVGITCNLRGRLRQHRADKAWWPDVYLIDAWLYPTRREALAWEAISINRPHRPLHNRHVPQPRPMPDGWHFAHSALDSVQLWAAEVA